MKAERIVPLMTTVFVLATAMAILFVNPAAAQQTDMPYASAAGSMHSSVQEPADTNLPTAWRGAC